MGGGSIVGSTYCCKNCQIHVALSSDVLNKRFRTKGGSGYLFNNVVNIFIGMEEERMLLTGKYITVGIFCIGCGVELGWKYKTAYEKDGKNKEGKFVLERLKIHKYLPVQLVGHGGHNPRDTLAIQIDRLQIAGEENS